MTQLPRISASKIKVFEECRDHYIAKYVLRMPQSLTSYGVVGNAVHKSIDAAYTHDAFPYDVAREYISKQFAEVYKDNYIGWGESDALRKTYAMLDNVPYDDYQPKYIELEFLVPFPADNPFCELKGFIDLVTVDDKIIDWKSQSQKPTKRESAAQLAIYYYAFTQMAGREPKEVFIFHLPTKKKVELKTEDLKNKLIELELTISQMIALESETEVKKCGDCGLFCPLYGVTSND